MQRYFLTFCTADRRKWFKDVAVVDRVRMQLSQSAVDHSFAVPAYCLMPDHVHVLAEGTTLESDLRRFASSFKQKSGFTFSSERHGSRLWQAGYYDRILRRDEDSFTVVRYILENPVRAGLVSRFSDYPYSGSDRYSLEELATACAQG